VAVSRRDLLFGTPRISVHGTDSPANASTTAPATPPADQPENHQHQRLEHAVSLSPGTDNTTVDAQVARSWLGSMDASARVPGPCRSFSGTGGPAGLQLMDSACAAAFLWA
jgi:hypothetical protein